MNIRNHTFDGDVIGPLCAPAVAITVLLMSTELDPGCVFNIAALYDASLYIIWLFSYAYFSMVNKINP